MRYKLIKFPFLKYLNIKAKALLGYWILYSDYNELTSEIIQHELIHIKQQRELLIIFAPAFYLFEKLLRRLLKQPSYMISFEREAIVNQRDINYLEDREQFAWLYYISIYEVVAICLMIFFCIFFVTCFIT